MSTQSVPSSSATQSLPVLFISHGGGPCFYMDGEGGLMSEMDKNSKAAAFFRGLRTHQAVAPYWSSVKSMLVISAHWEEPAFTVQESPNPPLYFDYYGFPKHTYELTWPAPGNPQLAAKVKSLLQKEGFPTGGDSKRGFDHGVFVPLKLVVPDGDVPTIQLSLHKSLDPKLHLKLGAALAPLRQEGVLIVCSGFATHNLQEFFSGGPGAPPTKWLKNFDGWLVDTVTKASPEERVRRLSAPEQSAPGGTFRRAHPREEHFTPIQVAVGAAAPEAVHALLGKGVGGKPAVEAGISADGAQAVTSEAAAEHESVQLYSQYVLGTGSMACFLLR